jgi:diguanylate cyclase (GGDEF)-like protein
VPEERFLILGGTEEARQTLARAVAESGHAAEVVADPAAAIAGIENSPYTLVFLLGGVPARLLDLLDRLLQVRPEQAVVVLGQAADPEFRAGALKRGAYQVLAEPVAVAELEWVLRNGAERAQLLQTNTVLRQEAFRDDLTDAYNRRYMERHMEEELERARRYERPFSVLFMDLDRLKTVNEAYGHLCGSKVLMEVAALVLQHLRKSDKIFRFGGDEFVVTLPETDRRGALKVANRLREAVKEHRFLVAEGAAVQLTASFGLSTFPQDGINTDQLLRHADQAMYLIKSTSRDGVGVKDLP